MEPIQKWMLVLLFNSFLYESSYETEFFCFARQRNEEAFATRFGEVVFIGPVKHLVAQGFTHCSWVGSVPVRCHLLRGTADDGERLLEKLLSSFHIAFLAETRINQVVVSINGAREIPPCSFDSSRIFTVTRTSLLRSRNEVCVKR